MRLRCAVVGIVRSDEGQNLQTARIGFRTDIEGLRGIAVLAVVIHHFELALLPHGYLGVDVFFVISGYVITGSVISRDWTSLKHSALQFFSRRFKRLAPALFVCMTSTSVLASFFIQDMDEYLETAVWASFGLSNIFLYKEEFDYFGSSLELNPFTHTWSLGIEEQFYLAFPFIAWLLLSGALPLAARRVALFCAFALCLVSLIAYAHSADSNPVGTFYLIYFRAWELGIGSALFILPKQLQKLRVKPVAQPIGLVLLIGLFAAPSDISRPVVTISAVATTSILILFPTRGGICSLALSNQPLRALGRISYSLYLWHWPVVVLARWTIGLRPETIPILFILMLVIAIASYNLIERPLRHAQWGKSGVRGFSAGFSGLLATIAILTVLNEPIGRELYSGQPAPLEQSGVDTLISPLTGRNGSVWLGEPCVFSDESDIGGKITAKDCTFGSWEVGEKRMLVVGNSFSAAFAGAFRELADANGWSVLLTSSWGAPPLPEFGFGGRWGSINQYYWEEIIPSLLEELSEGDILLLASDLYSLSPKDARDDSPRIQLFSKGILRLSGELAERGIELAMLGPLPLVRDAKCTPDVAVSQWFAPNGGPCHFLTREDTLQRLAPLRQKLSELERSGAVAVIDLFEQFCPGPECNYGSRDSVVLYRDEFSHPSLEAATKSARFIERKLGD